MPTVDGVELTQTVRKFGKLNTIPVFVMIIIRTVVAAINGNKSHHDISLLWSGHWDNVNSIYRHRSFPDIRKSFKSTQKQKKRPLHPLPENSNSSKRYLVFIPNTLDSSINYSKL